MATSELNGSITIQIRYALSYMPIYFSSKKNAACSYIFLYQKFII